MFLQYSEANFPCIFKVYLSCFIIAVLYTYIWYSVRINGRGSMTWLWINSLGNVPYGMDRPFSRSIERIPEHLDKSGFDKVV